MIDFMAFLSRCKSLKFLRTSCVFPTPEYILMSVGQDSLLSMDEIMLGFEGEARALEEPDERTRAWEINL
jgi:hypothetical protein